MPQDREISTSARWAVGGILAAASAVWVATAAVIRAIAQLRWPGGPATYLESEAWVAGLGFGLLTAVALFCYFPAIHDRVKAALERLGVGDDEQA